MFNLGMDLSQESLRFRLQGTVGDIGSWGHEYVRYAVLPLKLSYE